MKNTVAATDEIDRLRITDKGYFDGYCGSIGSNYARVGSVGDSALLVARGL